MRYLTQLPKIKSVIDANLDVVMRKVVSQISFGQSTDNKDQGQNITGQWVTGTSPGTANTEFSIPVNLGYIPVGFDVKRQGAAASFYDSGTPWTSSHIFLKCSAVSVTYTLFIH